MNVSFSKFSKYTYVYSMTMFAVPCPKKVVIKWSALQRISIRHEPINVAKIRWHSNLNVQYDWKKLLLYVYILRVSVRVVYWTAFYSPFLEIIRDRYYRMINLLFYFLPKFHYPSILSVLNKHDWSPLVCFTPCCTHPWLAFTRFRFFSPSLPHYLSIILISNYCPWNKRF